MKILFLTKMTKTLKHSRYVCTRHHHNHNLNPIFNPNRNPRPGY